MQQATQTQPPEGEKTKILLQCPRNHDHVNWYVRIKGDPDPALKDFTERMHRGECIVCGEKLVIKKEQKKPRSPSFETQTPTHIQFYDSLHKLDYEKLKKLCLQNGDSENFTRLNQVQKFIKDGIPLIAKNLFGL